MTHVYFVRHAEPVHAHKEDRTRPLTEEGRADTEKVKKILSEIKVSRFYSSPYQRSLETIQSSADFFAKPIITDERFRERYAGPGSREPGIFERRWADFQFSEDGGESLGKLQQRNVAALSEVLVAHQDETIVIGTHGSALSTIIHFYDSAFDREEFLRIVGFMPWILRMDFEGETYQGRAEILAVSKSVPSYQTQPGKNLS